MLLLIAIRNRRPGLRLTGAENLWGRTMDSEYSYEFRAIPNGGGRYMISVHHYRHLGPVSTAEEIQFDTYREAIDWLREKLRA